MVGVNRTHPVEVGDDADERHSAEEQETGQVAKPCHHALLAREVHVSNECLNPLHDCHSRKSNTIIALFNMVATVCGGGVLSLPLAFAKAGIIPTTLLMIYAATTTDFANYILVASARRTGSRTYGDVAQAAFGMAAQVVTTITLIIMLCGSLIGFQVLIRDIYGGILFGTFPSLLPFLTDHLQITPREASNMVVAVILLAAMPWLLQRDLHGLRHTCYIGFSSCILLMIAVIYRGLQQITTSAERRSSIRWYSTDPKDLLFAFPLTALCFFGTYNVLPIHAQLVDPTRQRMRHVLDGSILICFVLFYGVGLFGYLYAGDDTADNILLNFPVGDPAILAGRAGFGLTLMFGLPLILLPCRDALTSLPAQILAWQKDQKMIHMYQLVTFQRSAGAHLVVNGVDFDESHPTLLDPAGSSSGHSAGVGYGATYVPVIVDTVMSSVEDALPPAVSCDHSNWKGGVAHVLSTMAILSFTYAAAALAPGFVAVASILGSSIAMWIAFIVPTACYLKIREHKGLTRQATLAWLLLVGSCLSAVACTRQAILHSVSPSRQSQ